MARAFYYHSWAVHIDPANPAHVMACVGLLQIADTLWRETWGTLLGHARGWFMFEPSLSVETNDRRVGFRVRGAPLSDCLSRLGCAVLEPLDPKNFLSPIRTRIGAQSTFVHWWWGSQEASRYPPTWRLRTWPDDQSAWLTARRLRDWVADRIDDEIFSATATGVQTFGLDCRRNGLSYPIVDFLAWYGLHCACPEYVAPDTWQYCLWTWEEQAPQAWPALCGSKSKKPRSRMMVYQFQVEDEGGGRVWRPATCLGAQKATIGEHEE